MNSFCCARRVKERKGGKRERERERQTTFESTESLLSGSILNYNCTINSHELIIASINQTESLLNEQPRSILVINKGRRAIKNITDLPVRDCNSLKYQSMESFANEQ